MGLYDRDWYREEYKKKEDIYDNDFSLGSKKSSRKERRKAGNKENKKNAESSVHFDENELTILSNVCQKCNNIVQVRVRKSATASFTYTCPKCGGKNTVITRADAVIENKPANLDVFIFVVLFSPLWLWGLARRINAAGIASVRVIAIIETILELVLFILTMQQVKKGKASALTGIAAAVSLFTLIIIFSCGVLAGVLI